MSGRHPEAGPPDDVEAAGPSPAGGDALARAVAGAEEGFDLEEDEADAGPYQRAGRAERKLVSTLTSVLKVSRLHRLDNVVLSEVLAEFTAALGQHLARRRQVIVLVGENRVFVNGAAIKGKRQGHSWVQDFVEFLARFGLGGLGFRGAWTPEQVRAWLEATLAVQARDPKGRLEELCRLVPGAIHPPAELDLYGPDDAARLVASADDAHLTTSQKAVFYFARLLALVEGSHVAVRAGRSPDYHVRHVRTTLMKTIENLQSSVFQSRLLALTALPVDPREPYAGEGVRVGLLAAAALRLLGLSRGTIADVTFAALYHNLGRALVHPAPRLDGEGEEEEVAAQAVVAGVAAGLRGRGYGEAGLLRVIVAQEHRRAELRLGAAGLRTPHVHSDLVGAVAALVRAEQGTPWSPPRSPRAALATLAAPGAPWDAEVARLLRDLLGALPRGSWVRLRDGSVACVIDGGARRGGLPIARRVAGPDGAPDDRRTVLELDPTDVAEDVDPQTVSPAWRRGVLA